MKLCLGTVQFGLNYGIENKKIEEKEIKKILNKAISNNIYYLDTAQAYGNAEKLIGKYEQKEKFKIVTKITSNSLLKKDSLEELRKIIFSSLKNLEIKTLDAILLHNTLDMKNLEFLKNLILLKKEGIFNKLGVSIYSPKEAEEALLNKDIDYIQIPYNILDTRLDKINFFEKAKKNNKVIFARSIFLQGTLLKEHFKYPNYLENLRQYDDILNYEITKLGCTKLEFLLNFIKNNKNIDYIVIGIESYKHLEEIIKAYDCNKLNYYNFEKLREKFINVPENILNPSLWGK